MHDHPEAAGRTRSEQRSLLARFRSWGGTRDECADVETFLEWLGPLPAPGPSVRDVIEFLWGWVPRKYLAEEAALDGVRTAVGRFLEFLGHEGADVAAALRVARDRAMFLRRVRTLEQAGEAWFAELHDRLVGTGMEPFPWLPNGFEWGGMQGPDEAAAYDALKERLTRAVRDGEITPGAPGWRGRSAALQVAWLDGPQEALGGRIPRAAVAGERRRRAPDHPGIVEAMRAMQGEGLFRGLPLDALSEPAATGVEPETAPERFPIVALPPEEELARAAAASGTVAQVRALLELLGEGRRLTAKGRLVPADGRALAGATGVMQRLDPLMAAWAARARSSWEIPGVHLIFRWAREAGFVKVRHGRALPTKRAAELGRKPLDDWWALFISFVWKVRWPRHRWPERRAPFWVDELGGLIPLYLEELYREGGGPVEVDELARRTWEALDEAYGLEDAAGEGPESWRSWVAADIDHGILRPLAEVGAVRLDPGERTVQATPLGLWAARRLIELRYGAAPPVAGDLAARANSAEHLLAMAGELDLGPDEIRDEARRYAGKNEQAAEEFALELARSGPRVLAALASLKAFDPAVVEPHVRRAMETATSGAGRVQCAAWLEEHGFSPPELEVSPQDLAEATACTIVAVARGDGPEGVAEMMAELGDDEEQQAVLVEAIARGRSPFAAEALEAVSRGHRSKAVRKAARRELHRLRTGTR